MSDTGSKSNKFKFLRMEIPMNSFRKVRTLIPGTMKPLTLLLGAILLLSLASSAFAQGGTRGAISGTVKDEKGAALAGAQVEVINTATGVTERTATSDNDGNFNVTQIPAGTYHLVVSVAGFSKAEVPDVKVNVTETTTVNVPLKVGQISESVTVTGA